MDWTNPRSIEAKIRRLTREIAEIDQVFYGGNEYKDRVLYAGMLERKRDDIVRSAVLQMHTAIEDLLNTGIVCCVLDVAPEERGRKMRSNSARALRRMLFGAGSLGFDMKLNFAVMLGLLSTKTKGRLMVLNTLRNKCSHNWLLKMPVRFGKRRSQKKLPLLLYEGADLYKASALKEFVDEYGSVYLKLFERCL